MPDSRGAKGPAMSVCHGPRLLAGNGPPRRDARVGGPANEMGAGIAANPHYPVSPFARCPDPFPPASLAIRDGPGTRRRAPERSGDGLVGPLSGAGLTWDALHHLVQASAEAAALPKRWTAFHMPDLVRLNSWESRRSVIKPSTDFLVDPTVLFRLVLQPPLMSRRSDVSVVR